MLNEPVMPGDQLPSERHDIKLRRISFGYGDQPILRDVSMFMPFRSFTALIEPSGSGKSTACMHECGKDSMKEESHNLYEIMIQH